MATTWKFFLKSQDAWDVMYEDCRGAKHSIDLEQYILRYEPATVRFFDVFIAKAKAGIRVRMLCDMTGSYQIYESPVIKDMRDAGVEVQFVHPISPWRVTNFTSWFFRDHRKLLLIDGAIGHMGGMGIFEKSKTWRDTNIRIIGPVVAQMVEAFDAMWSAVQHGRFGKAKRKRAMMDGFMLLTNGAKFRQRHFYKNMSRTLKKATSYAYFSTPYLVPPFRFFRKLQRAARRGVDVRILVSQTSDSRIMDCASQSFFTLALKSGIRLYAYQRNVMHAKTAIIDDQWATVGSTNLDNQSFKFSYEANLVTSDHVAIAELKGQFRDDLEHAEELYLDAWEQRSIFSKFLEVLTWPAHWVL